MAVFCIGPEERAMLRALRRRAEDGPVINMAEVRRDIATPEGQQAHMARMNQLTVDLGNGFTVTYSVEDHPRTRYRHLSMAIDAPQRLPTPEAVELVMPELGFVGRVASDTAFYTEELAAPGYRAINVMQPFDSGVASTGTAPEMKSG